MFWFKSGDDLGNLSQRVGTGYSAVKVGDYVKFGSYPQNNSEAKEPIEWRVLEVNGNEALLISRYGLDCKRYHHEGVSMTWEECDLRKWFNNDFLKTAFSEEEQRRIKLSDVVNDNNPRYRRLGGNNTQDRVFCLSFAEAKRYFKSDSERKCLPTALARKHGADIYISYCYWWLRSPGSDQDCASLVEPDGKLDLFGDAVYGDAYVVRPALWLKPYMGA